jgi:hypothetical protein
MISWGGEGARPWCPQVSECPPPITGWHEMFRELSEEWVATWQSRPSVKLMPGAPHATQILGALPSAGAWFDVDKGLCKEDM